MSTKCKPVVRVAAVAGASVLTALAPTVAGASPTGTLGQQLAVYNDYALRGLQVNNACVQGADQFPTTIAKNCWPSPLAPGWTQMANWWWYGAVTETYTLCSGQQCAVAACQIDPPPTQAGNWWYYWASCAYQGPVVSNP